MLLHACVQLSGDSSHFANISARPAVTSYRFRTSYLLSILAQLIYHICSVTMTT